MAICEPHALDAIDQRRQEDGRGGDVFAAIGGMLAGIGLHEAELVGKHEGLAILLERLAPILCRRVDGHREKAELHEETFAGQLAGLDAAVLSR
jgi:hypothetical protein